MSATLNGRARAAGRAAGKDGHNADAAWDAFVETEGREAIEAEPRARKRFFAEHAHGAHARAEHEAFLANTDDPEEFANLAWGKLRELFEVAYEHDECLSRHDAAGGERAWQALLLVCLDITRLANRAGNAYASARARGDEPPPARPDGMEACAIATAVMRTHKLFRAHGFDAGFRVLDRRNALRTIECATDKRLDLRRWPDGANVEDMAREYHEVVTHMRDVLRNST